MKLRHLSKLMSLFWPVLLVMTACFPDANDQSLPPDQQEPLPVANTRTNDADSEAGETEDYFNTNRVIWQKPDMILNQLGNLEGKTVADIGAGTGFFAMRMAHKAERVIAIDIDRRFIDYLDSVKVLELPEEIQTRLETRLGDPNDPKLKANEVDAVIIVNTFMYIQNKIEYLRRLKSAIKPGGRLLIVDFKKKRTPIGPPQSLRIPIHEIEELFYEAGYKNIIANDTALDYQYILVGDR